MVDDGREVTEAGASQIIRRLEVKHGLLEKQIEGCSPWQLVRFETATAMQNLRLSRRPIPRIRLVQSLIRAPRDFFRLPREVAYVCKTFDSAYRLPSSGGYRDLYFDDLLEAVSGGVKFSSCDTAGFETNRKTPALAIAFDDTAVICASALLARFAPRYRRHSIFDEIAEALKNEPVSVSAPRLAQVFNSFWWRTNLYRWLLRRTRPSTVFCADSGQFALMHAAQTLGIPYVEVQHGIATRSHPNILPADITLSERSSVLVPDLFMVYGAHSVKMLASTLLATEGKIRAAGTAFIEKKRALKTEEQKATRRSLTLTLTTQGIATDELIIFFERFLQIAGQSLKLIIKLHPAYNEDRLAFVRRFSTDSRVEIIEGDGGADTHELIARADFHLSVSSTCHYDALGIGTPTVILKLPTHESVLELADLPGVYVAGTPEQLLGIVGEASYPAVPTSTSEYFFERGFVDNIEKVLSTLIGSGRSVG